MVRNKEIVGHVSGHSLAEVDAVLIRTPFTPPESYIFGKPTFRPSDLEHVSAPFIHSLKNPLDQDLGVVTAITPTQFHWLILVEGTPRVSRRFIYMAICARLERSIRSALVSRGAASMVAEGHIRFANNEAETARGGIVLKGGKFRVSL